MKSQMTDFAFAGKWGFALAAFCSCSRAPSASEPSPMPVCWRNRRREGRERVGCVMGISRCCRLRLSISAKPQAARQSINVHELVETQQHLTEVGQRLLERSRRGSVAL